MEFDLVTGIVAVIIAATSAVTIYLIAELSRKGPTYDDVKASHRHERQMHHSSSDNKSDSKRLKKQKKKVKQVKTASASDDTASEGTLTSHSLLSDDNQKESDHHSESNSAVDSAAFELEMPIAETKPVPKPKKAKGKPAKKVKSSKTAVAPETNELVIPEDNYVPDIKDEPPQSHLSNHKSHVVPNVSADHVSESVNGAQPDKSDDHAVPSKSETITESRVSNLSAENSNSQLGPNKLKKKKKKNNDLFDISGKSKGGMALNSLLPLIEQAELSHSELQIIIDTLLNKENDSEWYQGKQDPVLKLKKQLLEMEKTHADDMDTISGLQAKLSTLRTDLNNEKSYSKNMRESLARRNSELMVVSLQCQEVDRENEKYLNTLNQFHQQIEEQKLIIANLEEEKVTQQQMHIPHEQHHEAVLALQGQVNHLASQLQEQQNVNASLSVQLEENMRLAEFQSLTKELEEARSKITEYTGRIEALESSKADLKSKTDQLEAEISQLNQANKLQKIDSTDAGTEGSKNNGVSFSETDHSTCLSRLEDKETLVKNLNSELNQKEVHIEKLTNDIINSKNEANKKQTQIEHLNVEISSLKSLNTKVTSDLNAERIIVSELRTLLSQKSEEATQFSKEVETIRSKNNELRNRNYKLVEALSQAESSLKEASIKLEESSKSQSDVSSFKDQINKIFSTLNPPLRVDQHSDNEIWLSNLAREIKKLEIKEQASDSAQLAEENVKLQNNLVRYKSIVCDLEVMLRDLEKKIQKAEENHKHKSTSRNRTLSPVDQ